MVPFAAKVTDPLDPWVTDVTVRPGFSNVSFVSALNVAGVSSSVEMESATMSATGVIVTAIVRLEFVGPSLAVTEMTAEPL